MQSNAVRCNAGSCRDFSTTSDANVFGVQTRIYTHTPNVHIYISDWLGGTCGAIKYIYIYIHIIICISLHTQIYIIHTGIHGIFVLCIYIYICIYMHIYSQQAGSNAAIESFWRWKFGEKWPFLWYAIYWPSRICCNVPVVTFLP